MEGMNFNSMQISLDQMLPIMFSQVQDLAAGREQDIQSFKNWFFHWNSLLANYCITYKKDQCRMVGSY